MWEGDAKIDNISTYARWAMEMCTAECAVEGVCVVCRPAAAGGAPEMMPVYAENPARRISHFAAAVHLPGLEDAEPQSRCNSELETLYTSLGVVLLGTVCDGYCGIDVMCQMVGAPQTREERHMLRQYISDYLLLRLREPRMHDLLVVCQEVDIEDVRCFRSNGHSDAVDVPAVATSSDSAVAAKSDSTSEEEQHAVASAIVSAVAATNVPSLSDLTLKALAWATRVKEVALLNAIAEELPSVVA